MLLPREEECVEWAQSRVGHGFTNLEATLHMYREFATAEIDARHVVTSAATAAVVASCLVDLVESDTCHSLGP